MNLCKKHGAQQSICKNTLLCIVVAGVILFSAGCARGVGPAYSAPATAPEVPSSASGASASVSGESASTTGAAPTTSGSTTISPSASASPSPSAAPSSDAPEGIDPDKFAPAVQTYISDLNARKTGIGDLTVKTSVTFIIGFVDITFTDLTSWSSFTDTDKKEFITKLGKALDSLAAENIYPGTLPAVGTDTVLYTPSGQELAERTSLGIVKLYG